MNSNVRTASCLYLAFSTVALLSCVVASSAFADQQARSETVKFQDLNVDAPAGVAALYGRIHSAAKRVCSESDPLQASAASECARKAEADAIGKLSLPQLTVYYRMKTRDLTQPFTANR